jgi:hypothetical protein
MILGNGLDGGLEEPARLEWKKNPRPRFGQSVDGRLHGSYPQTGVPGNHLVISQKPTSGSLDDLTQSAPLPRALRMISYAFFLFRLWFMIFGIAGS